MLISDMDVKTLSEYQFLPEGGRACWHCYAYPIILQATEQGKSWGINYKCINTYFGSYSKNHIVKWFFISKDKKQFTNFIGRYVTNSKLLEDLRADTEDLKNRIVALVSGKKFSTYTNKELGTVLCRYFDLYKLFFKASMTLRTIDRGVIVTIKENFPSEEVDGVIRTLSVTDEPSFSLQEEVAVLNLAIKIQKKRLDIDSTEVKKGVQALVNKYAWGVLGYYKEMPNTEETYRNRLSALVKENPGLILKALNVRTVEGSKSKNKLLKKLSEEQRKIAYIASSAAYLKDFVKSRINESQYHFEPIFSEIATRTGKSVEYVKDLETEEVEALLTGGRVDELLVEDRVKENFIIALDGKLKTFFGPDAVLIEKKCVERVDVDVKELKGRIASPGLVRGRAVVVRDVGDFDKVAEGDILVVMNTSPDFIPVIRKAKGIIAEEGGITAHVSVISREFGVPCIVGVRNITEILKDGDLVEVDAERGIVKIVKRA